MNFHHVINEYLKILEKHKDQLYSIHIYPEVLKGIRDTISDDDGIFSYSSEPIKIKLSRSWIPGHTFPRDLNELEVILHVKDEIKIKKSLTQIEDPMVQLKEFNIIINSGNYTTSWHLDRHLDGDGSKGKYTHPIYHWTFGGYHLEKLYETKNFGDSILMRTPRLMHPPLDFILGLDFIFKHFIPNDKLEILDDPVYLDIIKQLQTHLWKPYSLAFAKNYCERLYADREKLGFDDTFVNSVIQS